MGDLIFGLRLVVTQAANRLIKSACGPGADISHTGRIRNQAVGPHLAYIKVKPLDSVARLFRATSRCQRICLISFPSLSLSFYYSAFLALRLSAHYLLTINPFDDLILAFF